MDNKKQYYKVGDDSSLNCGKNSKHHFHINDKYTKKYRKGLFLEKILNNKPSEDASNDNKGILKIVQKEKKKLIQKKCNDFLFIENKSSKPNDFTTATKSIIVSNSMTTKNNVYDYLFRITGAYLTQAELICLRETVFNGLIPQISRDEHRNKIKNIECLESFSHIIIPVLQNTDIQKTIQSYIINRRVFCNT